MIMCLRFYKHGVISFKIIKLDGFLKYYLNE